MNRTVARPRALRIAAATFVAVAATSTIGAAPAAQAAVTCDAWVATNGSDAAPGTAAAPWRSLGKAVSTAPAGSTVCLPAGQTFQAQGVGIVGASRGTAAAPITIRSGPGGRARLLGQVEFQVQAHDVVLTDLDLVGTGLDGSGRPIAPKGTYVNIDGDRITVSDSDITNPYGICIDVGALNAYSHVNDGDTADDVTLTRNRIHGCGMSGLISLTASDSGVHGVYLVDTLRAQVTDNAIYQNRYRGLQTWPKATSSVIARNVFDANATHVNIGSALGEGYPWYSSGTVVRDNIFTNRVTDFWPDKNMAQVQGNFPAGSPTYGNVVESNCFSQPTTDQMLGNGFARGAGNITADPAYRNLAAADFTLSATSACLGKGPGWIQPSTVSDGKADLSVSMSASTSAAVGAELAYDITVRNVGSATATAATLTLPTPAGSTVLSTTGATCSAGTTCALGDVLAGSSRTVRVVLGVTAPGTRAATASVSTSSVDASGTNNAATVTTAASGAACTRIGTAGADTIAGSAGADVLCLFGGNDVTAPGAGDDVVHGGTGADTVSYAGVVAGAVVNLTQQSAWDATGTPSVGWDVFASVEAATGSAYADTLVGSAGADVLRGQGGGDSLLGYGGDDTLLGGAGNDALNGGDGTDTCQQGTGTGALTGCER